MVLIRWLHTLMCLTSSCSFFTFAVFFPYTSGALLRDLEQRPGT